MSHTEIKSSRGGRRPGSGRKKLYRVSLLLRISKEANEALRLAAQRSSSTPSRLVEELCPGRETRVPRARRHGKHKEAYETKRICLRGARPNEG